MNILQEDDEQITINYNGQVMKSIKATPSCRKVFHFPEFVLKLDREEDQNIKEVEFYTDKLEVEDMKYFPELLDYGMLEDGSMFLVQKKISIKKNTPPTDSQRELMHSLREKYKLYDMCFMEMPNRGYNHNVTPVGKTSLKIWDVGCFEPTWKY